MGVLHLRIVFLLQISNTVFGVKVWVPNTNIDLNLNYEDRSLPCGNQRVVFPAVLHYSIALGPSNTVKGYVLPLNGVLKMKADGEIILGPSSDNTTCADKDSLYVGHLPTDWLDPDAWNSTGINKATPDAERIPCQYDDVVFPPDSQFELLLPDVVQSVRSVKIENEHVDQMTFDLFMQAGSAYGSDAKFILNKFWESGVVIRDNGCHNSATCVCQTSEFDVNCSRKKCPQTNCLTPIRPIGNCCFICGGVLQIKLDENNFRISQLEVLTYKIVGQFGGLEQLAVHIGRLRDARYQVVILEMGEYDGTSAEVVQILRDQLASQHSIYNTMTLESGSPGSMERYGIKIAAVMLLVVTLVFATVILFYHPPLSHRHDGIGGSSVGPRQELWNKYTDKIPKTVDLTVISLEEPTNLKQSKAQVFARFHNREGSVNSRENLSLTASFRNPLYYTKRDQKQQTSQPVDPQSAFEPRMSDLLAQDEM